MGKKFIKSWLKHMDFIFLDLIILALVYFISCNARYRLRIPEFNMAIFWRFGIMLLMIYFVVGFVNKSYKNIIHRNIIQEMRAVCIQFFLSFVLFAAGTYIIKQGYWLSRSVYFTTMIAGVFLVFLERILWKRFLQHNYLNDQRLPRLLVIVDFENLESCIPILWMRIHNDFDVKGIILRDRDMKGARQWGYPVVGNYSEAYALILSGEYDEVFLDINDGNEEQKLAAFLHDNYIKTYKNLRTKAEGFPIAVLKNFDGSFIMIAPNDNISVAQLILKNLLFIIIGIVVIVMIGMSFVMLDLKM